MAACRYVNNTRQIVINVFGYLFYVDRYRRDIVGQFISKQTRREKRAALRAIDLRRSAVRRGRVVRKISIFTF